MTTARISSGLRPGECRVTLTRNEREVLHLLLAIAREQPQVLVGDDAADSTAAGIMAGHVARIQAKLPRRYSGTY